MYRPLPADAMQALHGTEGIALLQKTQMLCAFVVKPIWCVCVCLLASVVSLQCQFNFPLVCRLNLNTLELSVKLQLGLLVSEGTGFRDVNNPVGFHHYLFLFHSWQCSSLFIEFAFSTRRTPRFLTASETFFKKQLS